MPCQKLIPLYSNFRIIKNNGRSCDLMVIWVIIELPQYKVKILWITVKNLSPHFYFMLWILVLYWFGWENQLKVSIYFLEKIKIKIIVSPSFGASWHDNTGLIDFYLGLLYIYIYFRKNKNKNDCFSILWN